MSEVTGSTVLKEILVSNVEMKDMMNLTEAEENDLKGALQRSQGTAQVWVHSHHLNEDIGDEKDIDLNRYKKGIEKLIGHSNYACIPVFAFVESPRDTDPEEVAIEEYAEHYGGVGEKRIYYVRTYRDTPLPSFDNRSHEDILDSPEDEAEKNWDKLAELFKKLGVQKVIVSGKEYYDKTYDWASGCVGDTIAQLKKRGIIPYLSKVTYPEVKGRKESEDNKDN